MASSISNAVTDVDANTILELQMVTNPSQSVLLDRNGNPIPLNSYFPILELQEAQFIPAKDNIDTATFSFQVRDNKGLESQIRDFSIDITPANDPPTVDTVSLPNSVEDTAYIATIQTNDIDLGDTVSFSYEFTD